MEQEIILNKKKYVSAESAASLSGFTRDHIGKLCRTKKILGKRVGKAWYVEEDSLHSFVIIHQYERSRRSQTLAEARKTEYERTQKSSPKTSDFAKSANVDSSLPIMQKSPEINEQLSRMMSVPAGVSHAALSFAHIPVYNLTPLMELAHRLLAIAFAVIIPLGIFSLLLPHSAHTLFAGVEAGIQSDAHSLANLYDATSHFNLENNLTGIAQNGNGEFAAAAISQSGIFTSLENAFSNAANNIGPSLQHAVGFLYSVVSPQHLGNR